MLWHVPAHAAVHRAALVIQHSSSWPGPRLLWKCVEFAQEAIGGLALLELAGVNSGQPPQIYDWGGGAYTVCQIDRQPTQVPDRCFGRMSDPNWSDWYAGPAGWTQRTTGVSGYSIRDGDIEGWTYTTGFGTRPPAVQFTQVCPPLAAPSSAVSHEPPPGTQAPPVSPSPAPAPALPSSAPTPTFQAAMAPSPSATAQMALASTGPPRSPPTPGDLRPLFFLGVGLLLLAALAIWNVAMRRGP